MKSKSLETGKMEFKEVIEKEAKFFRKRLNYSWTTLVLATTSIILYSSGCGKFFDTFGTILFGSFFFDYSFNYVSREFIIERFRGLLDDGKEYKKSFLGIIESPFVVVLYLVLINYFFADKTTDIVIYGAIFVAVYVYAYFTVRAAKVKKYGKIEK